MRAAVLALMLASLSACGVTLRQHALVVHGTSTMLDEVGAALQAECRADYQSVVAKYPEGPERDQQVEVVQGICEPLRADYREVVAVWKAYDTAVREARDRGDPTLEQKPARDLIAIWAKLQSVAERLGLEVAGPPGALTKLAGGSS